VISLLLIAATFAAPADSENLLINSGFETSNAQGTPMPWALFVMPQEGATGDVDGAFAMEGGFSIMLHTPEPYETEPSNNWSQIVLTDVASKKLHLTAHIRTEVADEAAVWLQCFSKNPARVIAAQTSDLITPVYGTMDWTLVEVRLTVPKWTDFVVVRCVLRGQGTAWFDAIKLVIEEDSPSPLEPSEPEEETPPPKLSKDELAKDILKISEEIQKSLRELESSNTALLDQVSSVQRELKEYRLRALDDTDQLQVAPLESLDAYQVRHPLVPHDRNRGN